MGDRNIRLIVKAKGKIGNTENWGQIQPKKLELTELNDFPNAMQTAQFKTKSGKDCTDRAETLSTQRTWCYTYCLKAQTCKWEKRWQIQMVKDVKIYTEQEKSVPGILWGYMNLWSDEGQPFLQSWTGIISKISNDLPVASEIWEKLILPFSKSWIMLDVIICEKLSEDNDRHHIKSFEEFDFIFRAISIVHSNCNLRPLYWFWLG